MINAVAGAMAGLFQIGLLLSGVVLVIVTLRHIFTGKLRLSPGLRILLTVLMVLMLLIPAIGLLPLPAAHLDNTSISEDTSIVDEKELPGTESVLPD